jgi:Uma2 family endonuclease
MSTTLTRPAPPKVKETGVRRRRWTRKEYYRAAEAGIFRPDERLELLDGEILEKMSPQNPPHATGIEDAADALGQAFGPGYRVRQQLPLVLTDRSEPEPDVVVARGTRRDYRARHPTAAQTVLVVEIADSSLRLDRSRKLRSYARAGIPEYWIVNLPERQLEVYRDPSGARYRSVIFYTETEAVVPLHAPQSSIRVADLLPPPAEEAGGQNGGGE